MESRITKQKRGDFYCVFLLGKKTLELVGKLMI
jgi:hypothetical protein